MWRMSEGSEFHCFEAQWEKQRWPKVFVLTRGYEVSVCLQTNADSWKVSTVGRSEKSAGDESRGFATDIWVCSLFCEEFAEEAAHDHICVLWEPVSLQSSELSVVNCVKQSWKLNIKYHKSNMETTKTQTRVFVASTARCCRIELMVWFPRKQNGRQLKCACQEAWYFNIMKQRSRAQAVKGMSACSTRREVG